MNRRMAKTYRELTGKHVRLISAQKIYFFGSCNETSVHVRTSCGTGVPLYDYEAERVQLDARAENHGASGLRECRTQKNQAGIDGLPTHIVARNG